MRSDRERLLDILEAIEKFEQVAQSSDTGIIARIEDTRTLRQKNGMRGGRWQS